MMRSTSLLVHISLPACLPPLAGREGKKPAIYSRWQVSISSKCPRKIQHDDVPSLPSKKNPKKKNQIQYLTYPTLLTYTIPSPPTISASLFQDKRLPPPCDLSGEYRLMD
ncbi:hypothetical protein F4824DRAFT_401987 [Ustulina deusta]|nr:hypothetical protein F4824DRAFT_401987 [Ustulina deusta]